MGFYRTRAMPHTTSVERRRGVGCTVCGAVPYEKCRRRATERTTSSYLSEGEFVPDGEGHWVYLKNLHPQRGRVQRED